MYQIEVQEGFDKNSGRVKAKVIIVATDPGLPNKIMSDEKGMTDSVTLWADTWSELEIVEHEFIDELKKGIDIIRKNSKKQGHYKTIAY